MLYSVSYEYIKRKVDVRVTDKTLEIFYNHNRIASHKRLYGRKGQYNTILERMPEDHQKYLEWNGDRFRKWAERLGNNTYKVVDEFLPPNVWNNRPIKAVWDFLNWLINIQSIDWKRFV